MTAVAKPNRSARVATLIWAFRHFVAALALWQPEHSGEDLLHVSRGAGIWWLVDASSTLSACSSIDAWAGSCLSHVSIIAAVHPDVSILVGLQLPQLFVLILGIWGVMKASSALLASRAALGRGPHGRHHDLLRRLLIANYGEPGWGVRWCGGGAVRLCRRLLHGLQAFKQRKA